MLKVVAHMRLVKLKNFFLDLVNI